MTLVILAFTACLASAPAECHLVELSLDMSLHACVLRGQAVMAHWIAWQRHETGQEYVLRGGYECSTGEPT